jgi:hypothetical protein
VLVVPDDLNDFPGGPFGQRRVMAAVAELRALAGWHIAPVLTETVTVDSNGGCDLVLPTRRLVSVSSVNSWTSGWDVYSSGILYRSIGWPAGRLVVTMTHGFDECPDDLLPVLAARSAGSGGRDPSVASVSVGNVQTTYRDGMGASQADAAVSRYSVRVGVV